MLLVDHEAAKMEKYSGNEEEMPLLGGYPRKRTSSERICHSDVSKIKGM